MGAHVMLTSRTRRLRRLAVAAAVLATLGAATYLAREPLLRAAGRALVHADPLAPSDAILVLSGGLFERELEAADLYRQNLAPLVLVTREPDARIVHALRERGVRMESTFEQRRRILEELGVPAARIEVLDGEVRSTFDEAARARRWVERRGASSLLVVTSASHTARARYIFRLAFDGAPVILRVVPASASDFDPDRWWTDRIALREGLFEWQKLMFYRLWY